MGLLNEQRPTSKITKFEVDSGSMICAYLDESGNTGTDLSDASQPFHHVGALLVPENVWSATKTCVQEVVSFARQHCFPADQSCELHGKEILQGSKGWRKVSMDDRLSILSRCLDVIEQNDVKMVAGGCDKKKLLRKCYAKPEHPHSLTLWLCLERIARVAKQQNQLAVLVADDCSWSHKELSRKALLHYREHGAPYGPSVDFLHLLM